MIQFSLLDESIISTIDRKNNSALCTLPEVLDALVRDTIDDFPALRPHQRHVWHALLVQIAALSMHRRGTIDFPESVAAWREALLDLTPDDPDGAAWALVAPLDRPALLQPPVPEGSLDGFKSVATPDMLDMLNNAGNHDIKRNAMKMSRAEHWLFALVSVQTQAGVFGGGKYGISRMNGGFASRPGIGIAPEGGPGRHFTRDVTRLLELRHSLLEEYDMYPSVGGNALMWLLSWDGSTSIAPSSLDLYYIDICRRVRLHCDDAGWLSASTTSTKTSRIDAKALKGRTGDGWTPLMIDGADRKGLTIDPTSFGFKKLSTIVFPRVSDPTAVRRAPLQIIGAEDDTTGLSVVARGVVRGQGKTEGYHERRIAVSPTIRRFMLSVPSDEAAAIAEDRVNDAGTLARKVLYAAALTVFTAAPMDGERKRDDDTAKARAGRILQQFDTMVDHSFFEDLSRELDALGDESAMRQVRAHWLNGMMEMARQLLGQCALAAPSAAMRTYRTRARARDVLEGAFRRYFDE